MNTQNIQYESPWLVYLQMMETSKVFVYDATMVHPYALLLFGGTVGVDHANGLVTVDKWIKFRSPSRIAILGKSCLLSAVHCLLLPTTCCLLSAVCSLGHINIPDTCPFVSFCFVTPALTNPRSSSFSTRVAGPSRHPVGVQS
jgi:hypothetical protein